MEQNKKSTYSPQKHEENSGDSKRMDTKHPQRITISNEEDENNSSVSFSLETEQIVQLLKNNAKDLVHREITFSEADWYQKGVLDVARLAIGPARLILVKRLKGVAGIFSSVEKKEYTAISQLDEFINEPTETDNKQMK